MSLLDVGEMAMKYCLNLGADEVEVYIINSRNIEVVLLNNEIHIARSQIGDGIGIRVFQNRGLGFASCNSFDEGEVKRACENGVRLAKIAPRDPYNVLPSPEPIKKETGIYDNESESFGVKEALGFGMKLLDSAKSFDYRVTVDSGAFIADTEKKAILSSTGVMGEECSSNFIYYIMGMAREKESVSSFDVQFDGTRFIKDIDVEKLGKTLAENVVKSLGASKSKSFRGSVILSPDAVQYLLISPILFSVNANNVQKGMSRFIGQLGKRVASNILTVEDDGTLRGGLSTESFDREGMPHRRLPIIVNGELKSYIYNQYTALKEGRKSTGHGAGGTRAVPSIGPTNILVKEGTTTRDEIVEDTRRAIFVTRFSGFPNLITGDFSGVVKGGWLIERGKVVKPLTGILISGNVFESLHNISGISKERKRVANFLLPYIRMENVSITGG
jgi:PmbA protein